LNLSYVKFSNSNLLYSHDSRKSNSTMSRTAHELGVETAVIAEHLEGLEQLLKGVAMMKELTLRSRDYLVSFGECMSTRLFAAYLNKIGHKARQVCIYMLPRLITL